MGWKENGKFGLTTGRTVRAPFARTLKCCRGEEMVLKFTRGTGNLSSDELQDFLGQKDIDDALGDFYAFTTRLLRIQGVRSLLSCSLLPQKTKTMATSRERKANGRYQGNCP